MKTQVQIRFFLIRVQGAYVLSLIVPCSCRLLLCPRTAVFCYCSWASTSAGSMLCKCERERTKQELWWENPRKSWQKFTEVDSSNLILLWRICDRGSVSRSWELWVQDSVLLVGCGRLECWGSFLLIQALQAWGEHHCGLRYDVQRFDAESHGSQQRYRSSSFAWILFELNVWYNSKYHPWLILIVQHPTQLPLLRFHWGSVGIQEDNSLEVTAHHFRRRCASSGGSHWSPQHTQ